MRVWVRVHANLSNWHSIHIDPPWRSPDGYVIHTDGDHMTVEWEGEAANEMKAAAGAQEWTADLLAVLAVEEQAVQVAWTMSMEWRVGEGEIHNAGGGMGGGSGFSPGSDRLEMADAARKRLRGDETVRAAFHLYERAALLMSVDRQAAMSLAYLAAEMVLAQLAAGGSWDDGAAVLGLPAEDATQLWASLQLHRHDSSRTAKATRRLSEVGRTALNEFECLYATRALLRARIAPEQP